MSQVFKVGGFCGALMLLILSSLGAMPDEENYRINGTSSHWTPYGWSLTNNYEDIRNYADRPDEQTLNKLAVEWQKPEVDALGNFCTIRGQVLMTDKDRKPRKPINWFQGVTVYLGTAPDDKPDWSKGMDQTDALTSSVVTEPAGKFQACIDLRKAKYDRAQVRSFQFGLALAKHEGNKTRQKVVWSSQAPALPSSVQMLTIPAAPELSRELALINRACNWPFADPNGVDLIRAVNALQPLGKERALAVLENYLHLASSFQDGEIVFWIIRLLFEPIQLGDRIPSPMIAVILDDRKLPEARSWPLNPMAIHNDVPFMLGQQIGMSGVPEQPSSHIRWARLQGVVRDKPLAPAANPLAAAEAILESRRFKALDQFSHDEAIQALRSQALAMVKGLVPPLAENSKADDAQWKSRLKAAADAGIHWDTKREQFVAGMKQ